MNIKKTTPKSLNISARHQSEFHQVSKEPRNTHKLNDAAHFVFHWDLKEREMKKILRENSSSNY